MSRRFEYDELIFEGRIVQGHKVGLRSDDGKVVPRDFFHYPGASVVLPVLEDGSVVMIRNYRFAVEEHLLELPAGTLDEEEDPQVCAARELTEETGYTAGKLEKLGQYYTIPGTADEVLHAYLATDLTAGPQQLETYENITVEVFSQEQVRSMISDGTIHDAKTMAALMLYWLRNEDAHGA
jgi:ADP-ribose pyrophosphatase